MLILSEEAWAILERAENLHEAGASLDEIAEATGQTPAQLAFLSLTGPQIRDALERLLRSGARR